LLFKQLNKWRKQEMAEKEKIKILVVDDEVLIRSLIFDILSLEGFEVELATNGKEALGLLRSKRYDLLISDFKMPVMDGLELLKAVRNENNNTSGLLALIMSAAFDQETIKSILALEAVYIINKPFGADELLEKVNELISINNLMKEGG